MMSTLFGSGTNPCTSFTFFKSQDSRNTPSFQTLTTNYLAILWIFRYCSVDGKGGGLVSLPHLQFTLKSYSFVAATCK